MRFSSCFVAISAPIFMKLWLHGYNLILWTPYFIKKIILTNRSRVNDPHILAQKQPKM